MSLRGLLVRHAYLPEVTLGWLFMGELKLATLEEPWSRDPDGPGGQRREAGKPESCIPDGSYIVRPHTSQHYPNGVFSLSNPILGVYAPGTRPNAQTYGRNAILIHSGNTTEDTLGCVLIGTTHAIDEGRRVVHGSRAALGMLKALLGDRTHDLHIRPTAGTSEL